ncbi:hypothetical protein GCM10010833_26100 [Blastomonas aquatica]|uniref:Uncharacterized protein n=1 Tax=Blastomonas aquatica TaxID=1510276 RepID=A0ABQ1JM19_9SPHN|nr:hypothetical protein GCM10010833_26100 [Blastomonas aquatica]
MAKAFEAEIGIHEMILDGELQAAKREFRSRAPWVNAAEVRAERVPYTISDPE